MKVVKNRRLFLESGRRSEEEHDKKVRLGWKNKLWRMSNGDPNLSIVKL